MIYFLYGEDSYRSKKKLKEIIAEYKKVHKSGLNLTYIDVKESDYADFSQNLKTASMFAEKKLLVLKNFFGKSKKEDGESLSVFQEKFLETISQLKEANDIIIVYEDTLPDQRTKAFKSLQKHAKCQEFEFLQPAQLRKWVAGELEKLGVKIDSRALDLLVASAGNDLWRMSNEISKLANYKKSGVIEKKDVEALVKPNIENDIFKTIDALAAQNKKEALNLMQKHLEAGDNSLYLLSMIAYQFKNLLIIKELLDAKNPYPLVAAKSGLHPFVVKKTLYLCGRFSMEQLKNIYQKIFQIDADIKTGKIEAEAALELLIAEI